MCQSIRQSSWEYITAFGHWGWVVLIEILSGATGAYLDISKTWGFPTWLWLVLLGIGLVIAPFIAFHKVRTRRDELKKELDNRTRKKEIRKVLAEFLSEGNQLIVTIQQSKEAPSQEVGDWGKRVANYLEANLGEDYVARFFDGHGLPMGFTRLSSPIHVTLESFMGTSLARLQQFMAELRD